MNKNSKQQSIIRSRDVTHFEDNSRKRKRKKKPIVSHGQFSTFLSRLYIRNKRHGVCTISSKTTRPSRVAGYPHYVFIRDFLWTIGRQEVVAQMHKVRFRSRGINWPCVFPCGPRRQEAPSATNLEQFRFQTDRNREEREKKGGECGFERITTVGGREGGRVKVACTV